MLDSVEDQAASAGDDLQAETSYDLEDAAEPQDKTEEKSEKAQETEKEDKSSDYAKQRKSDKQWQTNSEKAQKLDKLLEALGVSKEESKETDPVKLLQEKLEANEKEVQTIKDDSLRKDFEREVPAVKSEKYTEEWTKACKDKRDPDHKYHKLSYEEVWKIIKRDDPKVQQTRRELEKSESNPFKGTVHAMSTQVQDGGDDLNSATQALMMEELGYKKEDFA